MKHANAALDRIIKTDRTPTPNQPALVCDGHVVTWNELEQLCTTFAAIFHEAGLESGDRVLINLPNSIEYFLLLFSVARAGGIVIAVDVQTSDAVQHDIERRTSPRWIFRADSKSFLRSIKNQWHLELAPAAPRTAGDPRTPEGSVVMFSSGSSGLPKAVPLDASNFLAVFRSFRNVVDLNEGHRELLLSPAVHMDGFQRAVLTFQMGGTLYIHNETLSFAELEEQIRSHRIEGLYLPPAVVGPLSQMDEDRFDDCLLHIEVGSAAHSPKTLQNIQKMISTRTVLVHYGLTECSRATLVNIQANPEKFESVGRPQNNLQVRIVDSSLNEVSRRAIGQILVKGEQTIQRYWRDEFSERFHDQWYLSGDYGFVDDDGYLYFAGRQDDLMTRGGYHLYPSEIETACGSIPGIDEIVFISIPQSHSPANDILIAVVTTSRPNDSAFERKIRETLAARLPAHQRPNRIELVSHLPRTSSGKVDRKQLRTKFAPANADEVRMKDDILLNVRAAFEFVFGRVAPEELKHGVHPWDSLKHLEVLSAIEKKCSLHFTVPQAIRIDSFESALRETLLSLKVDSNGSPL